MYANIMNFKRHVLESKQPQPFIIIFRSSMSLFLSEITCWNTIKCRVNWSTLEVNSFTWAYHFVFMYVKFYGSLYNIELYRFWHSMSVLQTLPAFETNHSKGTGKSGLQYAASLGILKYVQEKI